MADLEQLIDSTIKGIKNSYGDKYSDRDYELFKQTAIKYRSKIKSPKQLVVLVENLFDIDTSDAKAMVY